MPPQRKIWVLNSFQFVPFQSTSTRLSFILHFISLLFPFHWCGKTRLALIFPFSLHYTFFIPSFLCCYITYTYLYSHGSYKFADRKYQPYRITYILLQQDPPFMTSSLKYLLQVWTWYLLCCQPTVVSITFMLLGALLPPLTIIDW